MASIITKHALIAVTICCVLQACKKDSKNISQVNPPNGPYTYLSIDKDIPLSPTYGGPGLDINGDKNTDLSIFNNELVAPDGAVSYLKYLQPIVLGGSVEVRDTSGTISTGQYFSWAKLYAIGQIVDTLNAININFSSGQAFFDFTGPVGKNNGVDQFGSYGVFPEGKSYFGFRIKGSDQQWRYGWGSVTITGNPAVTGDMVLNEICYSNTPGKLIKTGEH